MTKRRPGPGKWKWDAPFIHGNGSYLNPVGALYFCNDHFQDTKLLDNIISWIYNGSFPHVSAEYSVYPVIGTCPTCYRSKGTTVASNCQAHNGTNGHWTCGHNKASAPADYHS